MPRPSLLRTRIAKARNVIGLQQKEFSGITEIPLDTLRRYETGDNRLTAQAAAKISQKTGLSSQWLMGVGGNDDVPIGIDGHPFEWSIFKDKKTRDWDTRTTAWAEYLRALMLSVLAGQRGTAMVEELGASIDDAVSEIVKKYYLATNPEFKSVDEATVALSKAKKRPIKHSSRSPSSRGKS